MRIYAAALALLFITVVGTPVLIRHGVSIVPEEVIEMGLLCVLFVAGLLLYRAYRNELEETNTRYFDMTKHVGALNVQTVQVEAMYNEFNRIPRNRKDVGRIFDSLHTNILAAVNVPWVLTRIVEESSGKTLTEKCTYRADASLQNTTVSNKELLSRKSSSCYCIYRSKLQNVSMQAFCVFPKSQLNRQQSVLINIAINSVVLLYILYRYQTDTTTPK